MLSEQTPSKEDLRVACLLPSATDIVVELDLLPNLVGVTHECDNVNIFANNTSDAKLEKTLLPLIETLTISQIDRHEMDQATIHSRVQESIYKQLSLYTIREEGFERAKPSVILTQELCEVCAPSMQHVTEAVSFLQEQQQLQQQQQCLIPTKKLDDDTSKIKILSLEPESISDVADTFVTVGNICGVRERGLALKQTFLGNLRKLKETVINHNPASIAKIFMLEWLQPPFDGGHWVLDQIDYAGCVNASLVGLTEKPSHLKSKEISWANIEKYDPDCIVVACCGFNLERNIEDAKLAQPQLKKLRAFRNNRIYAADGNMYFARPGPYLVGGAAILARCAYDNQENMSKALDQLDFMPKKGEGWVRVDFSGTNFTDGEDKEKMITDIEDLGAENSWVQDFMKAHKEACEAKEKMYIDPETGYSVFTEYAHLQRGKCCGSGCRHCPYNHENLKNKVAKMQQPAFLYKGEEAQDPKNNFLSILHPQEQKQVTPVKVLFFSGGKDSFLAIRALARQYQDSLKHDDPENPPFALILLTTFDSTSRIIAHQEVPISDVVQQAEHLKIPLIGVPMQRGSTEKYHERIRRALNIIEHPTKKQNNINFLKIVSLAFGDLHLEHIRGWRETAFGANGFEKYRREYPLWKIPYSSLMEDLELSKVPIKIAACTVGEKADEKKEAKDKICTTVATVGTMFNREIYEQVVKEGFDGFGENGEFHSIAQVWEVTREVALGFPH